MEFDLITTLRVLTLSVNVVFIVLFPFLVRLRFERRPWQLWSFVFAVELAWIGDCLHIARRIADDAPWDWLVSPPLLFAGLFALALVLIPPALDE